MVPTDQRISHFLISNELKITNHWFQGRFFTCFELEKKTDYEVCPKCAVKSYSVHDRRWVEIKDAPVRGKGVLLKIRKRRFRCPECRKVFTEPVSLVRKGFRTTRRYRRDLAWA